MKKLLMFLAVAFFSAQVSAACLELEDIQTAANYTQTNDKKGCYDRLNKDSDYLYVVVSTTWCKFCAQLLTALTAGEKQLEGKYTVRYIYADKLTTKTQAVIDKKLLSMPKSFNVATLAGRTGSVRTFLSEISADIKMKRFGGYPTSFVKAPNGDIVQVFSGYDKDIVQKLVNIAK